MNEAVHSWLKAHTPAPTRRRLRRLRAMARNAWIRLVRLVAPPAKSNSPDGKISGCGYVTHLAFINVHALVVWHIHSIRPVDDLRPFNVDIVYVSHCLEHIGHHAWTTWWWRVLKPGGVLRLGVPDFRASGRNTIQLFLMGGQDYPKRI